MASSFQSPATTASTTVRTATNYDYRLGGGNPPPGTPQTPQTQWWYPPTTMDNAMHAMQQQNIQQNQQNLQQQQQTMPPVQTPPSPVCNGTEPRESLIRLPVSLTLGQSCDQPNHLARGA